MAVLHWLTRSLYVSQLNSEFEYAPETRCVPAAAGCCSPCGGGTMRVLGLGGHYGPAELLGWEEMDKPREMRQGNCLRTRNRWTAQFFDTRNCSLSFWHYWHCVLTGLWPLLCGGDFWSGILTGFDSEYFVVVFTQYVLHLIITCPHAVFPQHTPWHAGSYSSYTCPLNSFGGAKPKSYGHIIAITASFILCTL